MTIETLQFIASGTRREPAASALDIVYVHGLTGDRGTWGAGDRFWPTWMADDFPQCNVYVAEYDSAKWSSLKTGPGASFRDLATILIEALLNRASPAPVVFVVHSLGGIIVKQAIRKCQDSRDPEYRLLAKAVKGVAFLSTPHQGSQIATACDIILRNAKSTVAKELAYAAPDLHDLAEFFRSWASDQSLKVKAFYETERTWGVHVVDRVTANPNVHGVDPVAIQCDHIAIAKPTSRTDVVCGSVRRMIRQILDTPPSGSPPEPSEDPEPRAPLDKSGEVRAAAPFVPEGLDLVPRRDDVVMDPDQLSSFGAHTDQSLHLSVEGISGSGKTILVSHWVRLEASQGRWKRVIWHDSYGGGLLEDIVASVPELSIDRSWSQRAKARALLSYLERSNSILVLDDFHQVNIDDFSDLIEEACGRNGPCRVVTISQAKVISPRAMGAVRNFTPEHLTVGQVDEILSSRLRRRFSEADLKRLHEVTDGLPFAVTLFCLLIKDFGYSVDQLLSGRVLLSERLENWCSRAIDRLDEDGRRLVLGLSLIDGAIDSGLVDVVGSALDITAYHRSFEQVVSAHLFRKRSEAAWVMHSILAGYCRRTSPPKERGQVLLALARVQEARGKRVQAPNERLLQLAGACRYLIAAGRQREVERLLDDIIRQAKRLGQHRLMRSLLSMFADMMLPRPLRGWWGYHYVHCLFVLGDLEEAGRYLKFFQETSTMRDNDLRLSCQRLSADVLLARGKAVDAWSAIRTGDDLRRTGSLKKTTLAQFLGTKFNVLLALQRPKDAEDALNEALGLSINDRNRLHAGVINMRLSQLRHAQGDHSAALNFAKDARKDFEIASDTRGVLWSEAHIGLGEIHTGDEQRGLERISSTALTLAEFGFPSPDVREIAEAALARARSPEEAALFRGFLEQRGRV